MSAVNKNFVVKNGFEVNNDLILADAYTKKVGIGTTNPQFTLDVAGGIGATNFYLSGIGTFIDKLKVGTVLTVLGLGNSIGISTALPKYLLDIRSPVSTGQTALYVQGDLEVTGNIRADDIFYDDANIENLTVSNTFIANGVSSFNSTIFTNASLISSGDAFFQNITASSGIITDLTVSGLTNLNGYVDINNSVDISNNLSVSGVITALGGFNLGIRSGGTSVASGVITALNFIGAGNSFFYNSGTKIIDIDIGGGQWSYTDVSNTSVSNIYRLNGNVGIGTTNPTSKLTVSGDIKVTGITTISNTTESTTKDNGSLVTEGGVGIEKNLNVGGNLNVSGITTISNTTESTTKDNGSLVTEGGVGIEKNLNVGGKGTFSDLEVTGNLFIPGGGSLDSLRLRSYGISNDPTVYSGVGTIISSKLRVSGISTTRFAIGEKVKLFGVTLASDSTSIANIPNGCSFAKVGVTTIGTTYRYWLAQYDYRTGKVGSSTQVIPNDGITMTTLGYFNDLDHISITIARSLTTSGILVYRSENSATISDAKLIAILGPKELGGATAGISWKDYGSYEKTEWSSKTAKNEFDEDQIHFPNIATADAKKGWVIDSIISIGSSFVGVGSNYTLNSNSTVKLVHDNTFAFKQAITNSVFYDINSLVLPGGTYLVQSIGIPTGFTLRGDGKGTIIKQQYFANDLTDGGGNNLNLNGNVIIGIGTANITLQNLSIDGNNTNNILFDGELGNYLVYLENIFSSLISDIEIRNTTGNGLYVYNSKRLSLQGSSFIDGGLTDRYPFYPINAQESEVLRINNCLFENYSGSVDISVTSVASINGNIIRNAGTGLRLYAASKVNTSNNIILGPSDEFVAVPDIYDSDYNSVNITIQKGITFNSPVFLYLEEGDPKNLSSSQVTIVAGIGTIINIGLNSESLGTKFLNFNILTQNEGDFGRTNGYIQCGLNSGQTNTLEIGSILGFDIIGTEFLSVPVGLTTSVGISTGIWNSIGVSTNKYTVTLDDPNQFSGISTGDIVKLVNHSVTPDLSATELTVESKIVVNSAIKNLVLKLPSSVTPVTNGNLSGSINIKNTFVIAKGRVGVI